MFRTNQSGWPSWRLGSRIIGRAEENHWSANKHFFLLYGVNRIKMENKEVRKKRYLVDLRRQLNNLRG